MPLGTNAGAIRAGEFLLPFSSRTDRRPESRGGGGGPSAPTLPEIRGTRQRALEGRGHVLWIVTRPPLAQGAEHRLSRSLANNAE